MKQTTSQAKNQRAIGYIRVSTEDQAESGLSLAHQRAKIEAYAVATDLDLVAVVEDAGESAKSLNRPGIQKVIEAVRAGEVAAVVILKLDRITRSVRDLGTLVDLFDKTGASLVSVQDSINTSTAAGRLVLNVLGSVAQWEREAIGERTAAALAVKKNRSERVGTLPYGFDLADDGRTLIPNAHEQEGLSLLRELRLAGMSYRRIGAELEARGFTTKAGGKWLPGTVRNLCEAGR